MLTRTSGGGENTTKIWLIFQMEKQQDKIKSSRNPTVLMVS